MNLDRREERVKFLVRFVNVDLENIREGDFLNLKEDFLDFLDCPPASQSSKTSNTFTVPTSEKGPSPHDFSKDDFKKLQKETSGIIADVVQGRALPPDKAQLSGGLALQLKFHIFSSPPPGATLLWVFGETQDIFLYRLFHLLVGPLSSVMRCPECSTIFYRVRKQRYCSRRCVDRVNKRNWLKTRKGRDSSRKAARKSYQKKIRKRWPNAQIKKRIPKQ